ncbi:DoxX family protein [Bacillus sp. FJAT-50079]|uniref:DoxX family protein n=1 Tax=Bacillus sp. FJAT-50079 TaxID=2833577 RepID=UPI001BC9EC42|nr:DoxX family protein [Bacillus sp. FJAT-50079]MBS4208336.1 DoxX family protein [Bacillus sp. FJAT-50079]
MRKWFENKIVAVVWTVLRVWLGVQWLQAGWGKVTGGFDASGYLQGAIAKAGGEAPVVAAWYGTFLETVALPNAKLFSVLVAWGELLVGIGLIVGALTIPALIAAGFMNLNFLWAGTISTNPTLLLIAIVLLFVWKGATYYGADRFITPMVKTKMNERKNKPKAKGEIIAEGQA